MPSPSTLEHPPLPASTGLMKSFWIRDRKGQVRLRGSAEDPLFWFASYLRGLGASGQEPLASHPEVGGTMWLHEQSGTRLIVAD